MTVTLASAANKIAQEVLILAELGVQISPELEKALITLITAANKKLWAGLGASEFAHKLRVCRDNAKREADEPRRCIGCGCTDDAACFDPATGMPCSWVARTDMNICSVCAQIAAFVAETPALALPPDVTKLAGLDFAVGLDFAAFAGGAA